MQRAKNPKLASFFAMQSSATLYDLRNIKYNFCKNFVKGFCSNFGEKTHFFSLFSGYYSFIFPLRMYTRISRGYLFGPEESGLCPVLSLFLRNLIQNLKCKKKNDNYEWLMANSEWRTNNFAFWLLQFPFLGRPRLVCVVTHRVPVLLRRYKYWDRRHRLSWFCHQGSHRPHLKVDTHLCKYK